MSSAAEFSVAVGVGSDVALNVGTRVAEPCRCAAVIGDVSVAM